MKKIFILAASSLLLLTFSCKKNTEGNKSIIKQENGYSADLPKDSMTTPAITTGVNTDAPEYTERYVADDGSSALVTFKNTPKEKTISIRSNNKTISAPQKEGWPKGGVYGNFDITIVAKNDSVTITQEKNVIHLKKARGQ
ncbi:hypothetical protein [Chryseobacterium sp. MDT2-18]|uniref:hypothetical protein n=1 Tax=Chryseobacterium sp. MDT2-18 TaxID=1259136 RepID=UPI0027805C65|nr:hypothetical protein [Chryseobacterium sp. MDT2-18]MDQ0476198.1 hypothetical protein [Chryseobacterium sp. MDT2-18]